MTRALGVLTIAAVVSASAIACDGAPGAEGEGEGEGDAVGEGEGEGDVGEGEGDVVGEGEGEGEPIPAALIDAFDDGIATCMSRHTYIEDIEVGSAARLRAKLLADVLEVVQRQANDARAALDDDAVAACIADLASPVCADSVVPLEISGDSCSRLVVGLQGADALCEDHFECASGLCDFSDCTCEGGDPQPTPIFDVDALECAIEADCPPGSTCIADDFDATTLRCVPSCDSDADCSGVDELCVRALNAANGLPTFSVASTCAPRGAGAFCADGPLDSARCAAGLACVDFACAPPPALGDPCVRDCGGGDLFCDGATCSDARGDVGDACDAADLHACVDGVNCIDDVCVAAPALGEACDNNQFDSCGPGLFCDGLCVAKRAIGEACFLDGNCASAACDGDRLICVDDVRVGVGEDCTSSLCDGGNVCAGGVCAPRQYGRVIGDACSEGVVLTCPTNLSCVDGTCQPFVVVEEGTCSTGLFGPLCARSVLSARFCDIPPESQLGTCVDAPSVGAPCPDGQCADGRCGFDEDRSQVCLARAPLGGACDVDHTAVCDYGLVCSDGTCVELGALTESVGDVCSAP